MAVHKTPHADLKRWIRIDRQLGLIAALGVAIAAFTVPYQAAETVLATEGVNEIIELEDIEQTAQTLPPPPPPAVAPPPREVPDAVEIEEDVIEEITLDLAASFVPPAPPPAPRAAPPPPPPPPPAALAPPPPPAPDPEPIEPEIFEVAEVQPVLIGGIQGLQARVVYPPFAIQAGVEGQVVVRFVVDERGNVIDPEVVRSPNELLSVAAVTAILESRFTPGQQRGRPVRVRYAVPVSFQLRDQR